MRMSKFKVFDRNGTLIDEVWFTCTMSAADVRRSLIDHDGYDEGIRVEQYQ